MKRKGDLIAECVCDCWFQSYAHTDRKQLSCLSGLLWAIAKGTRWEEDARSGIESVCPEFFKDDEESSYTKPQTPKNDLVQFELHTLDINPKVIRDAFDWCLKNTGLKSGRGLIYNVNELYIVTRSQRIIDKINNRFNSSFSFALGDNSDRVYFITSNK